MTYELRHNKLGQAYIIWRGCKRVAIFPYGAAKQDVAEAAARKMALCMYNALEQKGGLK